MSPPSVSLLRDRNLYVIFGVTLIAILGVSSVTPAFPQIAEALGATPQSVGLVLAVFTLPGVVLSPVLGVMADRIGRKAVLVPSLVLFAVAGMACGVAPDFHTLLVLRGLQGVGAAALGVINLTIVGDLYRGTRRTTAMGYNAAVLSFGTGVFPAVGGALATTGWRAPFFLPVLALPVAAAVILVLEVPGPSARAGLGSYVTNALRLMRRPDVLALFTASVGVFVIIYGGFLTYVPFMLKASFDATALWIGIAMSGAAAANVLSAIPLGRLARRFGEHTLVKGAFVLYVAAMILFPLSRTVWLVWLPIALLGLANGLAIPTMLTLLMGAGPAAYRAAVVAVNGMLLRLGQTLGPLAVGGVVRLGGVEAGFVASAAVAAVVGALLAVTLRPPGPAAPDA